MPDTRLLALFAVCGVMLLAFALVSCAAMLSSQISQSDEDGDGWRHAGVE